MPVDVGHHFFRSCANNHSLDRQDNPVRNGKALTCKGFIRGEIGQCGAEWVLGWEIDRVQKIAIRIFKPDLGSNTFEIVPQLAHAVRLLGV